jgi:hypothetical protein
MRPRSEAAGNALRHSIAIEMSGPDVVTISRKALKVSGREPRLLFELARDVCVDIDVPGLGVSRFDQPARRIGEARVEVARALEPKQHAAVGGTDERGPEAVARRPRSAVLPPMEEALEVGAGERAVEDASPQRVSNEHVHGAVEHLRPLDARALPIRGDGIAMALRVAPRRGAEREHAVRDAHGGAIGRAYSLLLHAASLLSKRAQQFGGLFSKE